MKAGKILHYTALLLGFQASVFFTFFLLAEGAADLIEGKVAVIPIMIIMMIAVAGFIWAVASPRKGSLLMIVSGIVLTLYLLIIAGIGEIGMGLIFGLPFIVPGILFYMAGKN